MKSTVENHHDAVVVKLKGRIDIGIGDIQVRDILEKLAQGEDHAIILDLADVSYMDSSGIGELVAAYRNLNNQGIKLYLTNLKPKVYGLFDLTRLVTIFTIYDSNEDALQNVWRAA